FLRTEVYLLVQFLPGMSFFTPLLHLTPKQVSVYQSFLCVGVRVPFVYETNQGLAESQQRGIILVRHAFITCRLVQNRHVAQCFFVCDVWRERFPLNAPCGTPAIWEALQTA